MCLLLSRFSSVLASAQSAFEWRKRRPRGARPGGARRGQRLAAEVVGAAAIHRARARAQQAGTRVRGSAAQLRQPRRGSAAGHQPCGPAHAGPGRTLSCPDAANWPNAASRFAQRPRPTRSNKYLLTFTCFCCSFSWFLISCLGLD